MSLCHMTTIILQMTQSLFLSPSDIGIDLLTMFAKGNANILLKMQRKKDTGG